MRTIGIDISQIVYPGSGVSRYLQNLVESLILYDKENRYIFFCSSLRGQIPQHIISLIKPPHLLKRCLLPPSLLEPLNNRLHRINLENFVGYVDIFITSDWTEPPSGRAKKITVIHDLIIYKYPETLPKSIISSQKRRLSWVKKESSLIICDSQTTKNDAVSILDIPQNKLKVIFPSIVLPDEPASAAPTQKKPFILTVGKLEPRKNFLRLIDAFVKANLHNVELWIAGVSGWGNLQSKIFKLKSNKIRLMGYVSDETLRRLYRQALFFVYPSIYEGFGYPVVEAMSYGCPVATSNTSSLREIAEGYSILFDPLSVADMAAKLKLLANDEQLRSELSRKSLKRAADFSLEKFYKSFLSAINSL